MHSIYSNSKLLFKQSGREFFISRRAKWLLCCFSRHEPQAHVSDRRDSLERLAARHLPIQHCHYWCLEYRHCQMLRYLDLFANWTKSMKYYTWQPRFLQWAHRRLSLQWSQQRRGRRPGGCGPLWAQLAPYSWLSSACSRRSSCTRTACAPRPAPSCRSARAPSHRVTLSYATPCTELCHCLYMYVRV